MYLENSTDLAIMQEFAATLNHPARICLERPFVKYVETNLPQKAREHFFGLREAKQNLVGIAIFDRLDRELAQEGPLVEMMWRRREIENYICFPDTLIKFAVHGLPDDLLGYSEKQTREQAMRDSIDEVTKALKILGKDPLSEYIKVTDDFFDPLFRDFYQRLKLPLQLRKSDYHILARLVPSEKLDSEIKEKLDAIVSVAGRAASNI